MKNLIWEGKKLTVKEASLLIWGDLARIGGNYKHHSKYFPLVQGLMGQCPYCDFYKMVCRKCLLFRGVKNCSKKNSLFQKWHYSVSANKYWAQKIYNRILKMPDLLPGENPPEGI